MAAECLAPDATRRSRGAQAEGPQIAIREWPISAPAPGHPVVTGTAEDSESKR